MKNIIISLESAIDRRKHINNEFSKHNVDFEFFDALTPDTAQDYAKNLGLNIDSPSLTLGELACMMSHVAIWKKAIDEDIPYVTIFEDDVYLGEDAELLLNSDVWINPEWHIVKIEAFSERVFLSSKAFRIASNKRYIAQLQGKNLGTAGYILSLHGAQMYLDYILRHKLLPLDELMFDDFIKHGSLPIYQMSPALCIQETLLYKNNISLPSTLLQERRKRMDLEKQEGLKKVKKEVVRLITQVRKALFSKEVPFH